MVSTASCFAQKWVLGVLTGVSKRRCCCKLSTHMWMSGRLLLLTTVRDGTREKECEMCFLLFACFLMETKSGQILKEWSDSKKGEKDPLWVEEWQWSAYMNGYRGCGFDRGSSSSSFWKRFSFSVFPFSLHPFPFLVLEWLLIPPGLSFYVYVVCVTKRYMFFFFMTDWAVFVCLLIHWCMKGGDERKKMHVCVWELLKDAMFENVELWVNRSSWWRRCFRPSTWERTRMLKSSFPRCLYWRHERLPKNATQRDIRYQKVVFQLLFLHVTLGVTTFPPRLIAIAIFLPFSLLKIWNHHQQLGEINGSFCWTPLSWIPLPSVMNPLRFSKGDGLKSRLE